MDTDSKVETPEELALKEWRRKYQFEILEKSRKVLEDIRDLPHGQKTVECPDCGKKFKVDWASIRDINEATKTLLRMVSGLQPDKVSAADKKLQQVAVNGEVSDELLEEIERLAHGGDEWKNEPDPEDRKKT